MHPFEYHLPFQSAIMAVNFQSGIGESWWIILRPLYVLESLRFRLVAYSGCASHGRDAPHCALRFRRLISFEPLII